MKTFPSFRQGFRDLIGKICERSFLFLYIFVDSRLRKFRVHILSYKHMIQAYDLIVKNLKGSMCYGEKKGRRVGQFLFCYTFFVLYIRCKWLRIIRKGFYGVWWRKDHKEGTWIFLVILSSWESNKNHVCKEIPILTRGDDLFLHLPHEQRTWSCHVFTFLDVSEGDWESFKCEMREFFLKIFLKIEKE